MCITAERLLHFLLLVACGLLLAAVVFCWCAFLVSLFLGVRLRMLTRLGFTRTNQLQENLQAQHKLRKFLCKILPTRCHGVEGTAILVAFWRFLLLPGTSDAGVVEHPVAKNNIILKHEPKL